MSLIPKTDILVVKGDWNAKVGKDAMKPGEAFADHSAMTTQMREDSDFWSSPPLMILFW